MNIKIPKRSGTTKLASLDINAAGIARVGEKCIRSSEQMLCA